MFTTLIDADDLAAHLQDESWVVLDARFSLANTEQGRQAYNASRIPGAQYAHLDEHLSGTLIPGTTGRHPIPDRDRLADQFTAWGIYSNSQVVVYDDKVGAVAARLWWLAKWMGHEKCAVLNGGLADWQSRALRMDSSPVGSSDHPPQNGQKTTQQTGTNAASEGKHTPQLIGFKPSSPLVQMIDIDQAASGEWQLIDARESERYAGENEPIDPVAGHIKGALNRPFIQNVDESGRFLPREALRLRFESLSDQNNDRPVAHYCGSGVTAAHNILAMLHAGLSPGALYAGSFSEWITRDGDEYPVVNRHR